MSDQGIVSFLVTYFRLPFMSCALLWYFRQYSNSWFWENELWGNGRIAVFESTFVGKGWTSISMDALKGVLRTTRFHSLSDMYVDMLHRIMLSIPSIVTLPSSISQDVWDDIVGNVGEEARLLPNTKLLDFYHLLVTRSEERTLSYPMFPTVLITKIYKQLQYTDAVWDKRFGHQRTQMLVSLFQNDVLITSTEGTRIFHELTDTTDWNMLDEHSVGVFLQLPFDTKPERSTQTVILVSISHILPCLNAIRFETSIWIWRCLHRMLIHCPKIDSDAFYPTRDEIVEKMVHICVQLASENVRSNSDQGIKFECAVNALYTLTPATNSVTINKMAIPYIQKYISEQFANVYCGNYIRFTSAN